MFKVDAVFTHGNIARQMSLVHAAKGSQEVARPGPHSLRRVDVDLTNAIAIVIACPFVFTMINGDTVALNLLVASPLIGIRHRVRLSEPSHMLLQGLAIGVFNHTQAHLPTFSPNRADDRRPIIVIGAVPSLFVGAPSRGIGRIAVLFAFFPPHSETFHRFQ